MAKKEETVKNEERYLFLLVIFHYIFASVTALFSLFPLFNLGFGIMMLTNPQLFMEGGEEAPPEFIGWIFVLFSVIAILIGLSFAVLMFLNGRYLQTRKHHMFCLVASGIECLVMPFGTILGVFTLILLSRPSVEALFKKKGQILKSES